MTLIGAWVDPGGRRAFAWADSETYLRNGAPGGHVRKLHYDAALEFAVVGAGDTFLLEALADAASLAVSFDRLLEWALPRCLKEAAAAFAHRPEWLAQWTICAVGRSDHVGRLTAAVLRGADDFAPTFVRKFATPYVHEIETLQPETASDLAALARQQMAEVRRQTPLAGDGTLSVATLFPGGVSVRKVCDLGSGEVISLAEAKAYG